MTDLDDLLKKSTAEEILETMLSAAEVVGVPVRSWRVGGALRVMYSVCSTIFAGYSSVAVDFAAAQYLNLASGGWLTLSAKYGYGVERITATFATGEVTLTNVGSNFYTFDADEIQFKNPTTGKVYSYSGTSETMNPGESKIFNVRAVEQGSDSSTAANTITDFETTFAGLVVNNAAAVLGGDAESDDELRARCLAKLGTISLMGPESAYSYAVTSATRPDGSAVDINRHSVVNDSLTGIVTVTCASPSGTPDPLDLGYVEEKIDEVARPDIVEVIVQGANTVAVGRAITIWARSTPGVAAADIQTAVETALDAAMSAYPIGGLSKPPTAGSYLYEDFLKAVAINAHPTIYEADGLGPDLALASDEVAELTPTYTIRIV